MLSPQLRRKVHDLWSLFWTAGLSNPLVSIEQITYLLFIRQLEALDRERVKNGKKSIYERIDDDPEGASFEKCRWSYIRDSSNLSFALLNEVVFPWLRNLENRVKPPEKEDGKEETGNAAPAINNSADNRNGERTDATDEENSPINRISSRLSDAYFILDVNKTETLKSAVSNIDSLFRQLDTRSVNADIMGDIFEYLLEEVKESGKNGQFRTPRHVIRFMVQMLDPGLGKTVLDPACGSGGFLINCLLNWKAQHTDHEVLRLEWDGTPHDVIPVWPAGVNPDFSKLIYGYDNDRTMVRIAWMNLILHDLESPEVSQLDSLSKRLSDSESGTYDYILANPPFTGSVDEADLSENRTRFPAKGKTVITTKSELLFVWLMLDLLKIGGRTAVIVPDGVLFGNTNAHRELRRQLLFENTLEAVVSLPANMFQPYSGVKTSILFFQKAGTPVAAGEDPRTREVWFYEVNSEAFSLDQKRKALYGGENDLWDALEKFKYWSMYLQGGTGSEREGNLVELRAAAISKSYYQPDYWEERWRVVDDEFLKVFPEKAGDKGHSYALHELWPETFAFDKNNPQGAGQYDEAVIVAVGPKFETAVKNLIYSIVVGSSAGNLMPDKNKIQRDVSKGIKALTNQLLKKVKDEDLLDRDFAQFGLNALKGTIKMATENVNELIERAPNSNSMTKDIYEYNVNAAIEQLNPLLKEFAKLDGYNIWRRNAKVRKHEGKLTTDEEGKQVRVPAVQSWVVPVRKRAELKSWGEEPRTGNIIDRPTHLNNSINPDYLNWLRDTLKIYDSDGTVKKEFLDRLDPDCLEALDFNLSAGRHKPFVFEAGEHRPPEELIGELTAVHKEVLKRLGKLQELVGGGE